METPGLSTTDARARAAKVLKQIGLLYYALAALLGPFYMWIGATTEGVILAVLLVSLGFCIHKLHSRAAAIAASLLFLVLALQGFLRGQGVGAVPLVLFSFATRAVRASFDYHAIKT